MIYVGQPYSSEIERGLNGISDFYIIPNPASNLISIESNKDFCGLTYSITDLTGRQILSGKLVKETTIDITCLASGLYFFHVNELASKNFKLVKQ